MQSLVVDDKMSVAEIAVKIDRMNKIESIKLKYQSKVKQRKDGRFYVYINRKQYCAHSEDELYLRLYEEFYKEWTMETLFPEYLKWRNDTSPVKGETLRRTKILWEKYFAGKEIVKKTFTCLVPKDFIHLYTDWTKRRELTSKAFYNNKSIINEIYRYAINELEIVDTNVAKYIDSRQFPMKQVNNDGDVFLLDERRRILEYLKDDNSGEASAIRFAFYIPIRIGELLALTWDNIDGNRLRIKKQRTQTCQMRDDLTFSTRKYETVEQTKGFCEKGMRYVFLSNNALEILKAQDKKNEYIFVNKKNNPLTEYSFNKKLKSVCQALGIKPYTSHKIRFCVASMYYEKGIPITQIQQFLGHSTVQMTMHYLRDVMIDKTTEKIITNLE